MPASPSTVLIRVENQNQTLSRLIGPPNDSLRSKVLTILVGVASPATFNASEKLSPCRSWLVKLTNVEFENRLPPSRGMKLMRTPAVGRAAASEVVSRVTSAPAPQSGVGAP